MAVNINTITAADNLVAEVKDFASSDGYVAARGEPAGDEAKALDAALDLLAAHAPDVADDDGNVQVIIDVIPGQQVNIYVGRP